MSLEPEQLRARMLDELGPHADEAARAAIEDATIATEFGVSAWEGSHGTVRGVRVILGLDVASLVEALGRPALRDAVEDVVARAVASVPGHALADLVLRWSPPAEREPLSYRELPPRVGPETGEALRAALVEYLGRTDQAPLAAIVAQAAVSLEPGTATVTVEGPGVEGVRRPLENAVSTLLGTRAHLTARGS